MMAAHRFARVVHASAGIYGLLVMLPQYWMENRIALDSPPAITHPEYFYGFIGVVIAWQLVLLLIARGPARYRAVMPIAVVEKIVFFAPVVLLYSQQRVTNAVLGFGILDFIWASLFAASFILMRPRRA